MPDFKPCQKTTGIGSVPFTHPDEVMDFIRKATPNIPFWPQLIKRGPWENMMLQFTRGLPALRVDPEQQKVEVDPKADLAEALTVYYEAEMNRDLEAFALTPDTSAGFFALLDFARSNPEGIERLKGQVTGPVTFCLGIKDVNGQAVLYNQDLKDALAKGLGLCGAWQAEKLKDGFEAPIIFLDEPSLTGLGSAFMAVETQEVIHLLNTAMEPIHESGGLCGVHVCGNTDWATILKSNLDVVNFDAYGYGQGFALYIKEIKSFLERGGVIAWGIVPTLTYTGQETLEELVDSLKGLMDLLVKKGIDRSMLEEQSLITPACGMGSRTEEESKKLFELLTQTGEAFRS